MDLSYSADYLAYRDDVRAFLAAAWDKVQAQDRSTGPTYTAAFRRAATERGYLYRSIPRQYGAPNSHRTSSRRRSSRKHSPAPARRPRYLASAC